MNKFACLLYLLFAFIVSCQRSPEGTIYNFPGEPSKAATQLNISYGNDAQQLMDVYLPANRSKKITRSLVLIHGGGWNSGNKSDLNYAIEILRKDLPDYAFFTIDYRLASEKHLFPTQEIDVQAALKFIVQQATKYQINTSKITLLGVSAGAHLALLQGYKHQPAINAIIDFFGPTDLLTMYQNPWHSSIPHILQTLTGTTPSQNKEAYIQSSPVNFITPEAPPTLILHGLQDDIVSISQSHLLIKMLASNNVPHQLITYPSEKHGWEGANLNDSFKQIVLFLKKYNQ